MPSQKFVPPPTNTHISFRAIGTHWSLDIVGEPKATPEIVRKVKDRIDRFDRVYSRFRADSTVTSISQRAGSYTLPEDGRLLLDFYRQLYELTNGYVTPLIGQALADAGYDARYRLIPNEIAPVPPWDEVLDYRYPKLRVRRPVLLDFGAAGKGYLVDLVAQLISNSGITEYTINAGGDIFHSSRQGGSIRVGLEHPEFADQAIGVITLQNGALCGSAGSRRRWSTYTHHLDPFCLLSPTRVRATWVMAPSTLVADGISTSLFFVEPEQLAEVYQFDYLIVYDDYSFKKSKLFTGELFIEERQIP